MKVTGPTGPNASSSARRPAAAAGGFFVPAGEASSGAASTQASTSVGGVTGLSALMALQGVETATERRRRAVRRGHGLLDRLDALKLSLLSGRDGAEDLAALGRAVAEARPDQDAPGLDAVLDQIDLRAAVELAKAERRPA